MPEEHGAATGGDHRGRTLDSVMPILLFVGLNRVAGLGWAVLGATAWGVKAAVSRRRRGQAVGRFLPILVAYLVFRGVIGIVTDSEAVYFGIGIGTKAGIGLALIATTLAGRPFLGRVLHLVLPVDRAILDHEACRRTLSRLTAAWGGWLLATSAWDVWLFNQTSAEGYVVIRAVVGWPAGILLALAGFWYADRSMRAVPGFPGLMRLLEEQDERRRRG